jgi:hypothetical protein
MHFEDSVLARLADPQRRSTLFEGPAASLLALAAFGLARPTGEVSMAVNGVTFSVSLNPESRLEVNGRFDQQGRFSAEASLPTRGEAPVADAVLHGLLSIRTPPVLGRITAVDTRRITLPGVSEIDAAGGSAADPVVRERAGRLALGRRLIADNDELSDDVVVDLVGRWLDDQGFGAVRDFVIGHHPLGSGGLGLALRFEPLEAGAEMERSLPFKAAALIRQPDDGGPWLLRALRDARQVKQGMMSQPIVTPVTDGVAPRDAAPVIVFVPMAIFSDAQWPGAEDGSTPEQQAAQRAAAAGGWLAAEGVALMAV